MEGESTELMADKQKRRVGELRRQFHRKKSARAIVNQETLTEMAQWAVGREKRQAEGETHRADEAEKLARIDSLTGLRNRDAIVERLEETRARIIRSGGLAHALFLDLDGFKPVNDAHGHGAGDEILVEVAKYLREISRAGDTVGRLGGDEFVVITEDGSEENAAAVVGERYRDAFDNSWLNQYPITASVGVASLGSGDDFQSADSWLNAADMAMYAAKRQGGDRVGVWDNGKRTAEVLPHFRDRFRE